MGEKHENSRSINYKRVSVKLMQYPKMDLLGSVGRRGGDQNWVHWVFAKQKLSAAECGPGFGEGFGEYFIIQI